MFAERIRLALGAASTVINVGASTGSYEPRDRMVVAVDPSALMLSQRRPDAAPAVRAVAEALPFEDDAFDAAMGRAHAPPLGRQGDGPGRGAQSGAGAGRPSRPILT